MASPDPEIKDGFTLPVWMKTKPAKEFEPFAASPPAPEDSFFYMRYPNADALFGKPKFDQDLTKVIRDHAKDLNTATAFNSIKEKDWSKHTKPCQDVLHGIVPINTTTNSITSKPKPAGTDDGFKGEGAACGTSVVKVAQELISSTRGYNTAAAPEEAARAPDAREYNLAARRGSRSLPATPAHSPPTSPNTRRRRNYNRYFTSPFEPTEDASNRSWLTMALLGFKKDLTTSSSTLAEEDAVETRLQGCSLAQSVESLGPAPSTKDLKLVSSEIPSPQPKTTKSPHTIRPKPSELREMNFWSPTSM